MVSVVVLRGSGADIRMLLVQRDLSYLRGAWSYIAGHLEPSETGARAALRELHEETGLRPEVFHATSFCEQVYIAGSDTIEIVPAFVAQVSEDAQVRLNAENTAWRWVTLAEAGDLVPFGSQRDLLAHVEREFVQRQPSAFLRIDPE